MADAQVSVTIGRMYGLLGFVDGSETSRRLWLDLRFGRLYRRKCLVGFEFSMFSIIGVCMWEVNVS